MAGGATPGREVVLETGHFAKLGLAPSDNDNRRVIAALKYLDS
jgi:hypothetical protein